MTGETNLAILLKSMKPELNEGEYVFCTLPATGEIMPKHILCTFREKEGVTAIINKTAADKLHITYSFVASWITLTIHSSLEAVGFTAALSKTLSEENISCNIVAAYYHDHLFVATKDTERAMKLLQKISET